MTLERYVIHVTKQCNMRCKYCYETDRDSIYTWEETKQLIDNLIEHNTSKQFDIEYLGGEPLLAFDLIKQTTEYMESLVKDNKIKIGNYGITTNGTILDEEIIKFLKKTPNISWAASMDGTLFMNSLRVFKDSGINSHDTVIENHKRLEKEIGIDRISIHMVTTPFNIGYLSKGIDHLYNEGVRHIGIGTIESTIVIGKEYCDRYIKELDIVSKKICNGEYPGLSVSELEGMKPRDDVRHYVKDPKSGKTIAESYGRSGEDMISGKKINEYNAYSSSSNLGELITDIREIVYTNHQRRLGNIK